MRTIVLIAAMVLASASAQAGESRSLSTGPDTSVSSPAPTDQQTSSQQAWSQQTSNQEIKPAADQRAYNDTPVTSTTTTTGSTATTGAAAPVDTGKGDAPRYAVRPSATQTTSSDSTSSTTTTSKDSYSDEPHRSSYERRARAEYDSYRHGGWSSGRIIGELHRHGIYW